MPSKIRKNRFYLVLPEEVLNIKWRLVSWSLSVITRFTNSQHQSLAQPLLCGNSWEWPVVLLCTAEKERRLTLAAVMSFIYLLFRLSSLSLHSSWLDFSRILFCLPWTVRNTVRFQDRIHKVDLIFLIDQILAICRGSNLSIVNVIYQWNLKHG